jgi:starch synthase
MVADGRSGLLVPPDDPAALALALAQTLETPEQTLRMGEFGRTMAAVYHPDAVLSQTLAAYGDVGTLER